MSVIAEINAERKRQKSVEGWTEQHDNEHTDGSLAEAAACYASEMHEWRFQLENGARFCVPHGWPRSWHAAWWKPKDRRRNLIRAAALIVAEIERIDRSTKAKQP